MIPGRVIVTEDPVAALHVISMPEQSGPWRSVIEIEEGLGELVYVSTDDDTCAERVYFVV